MGRGQRERVDDCIYRDAYGYAIKVQVGPAVTEERWPGDSTLTALRKRRDEIREDLRQQHPQSRRGTLAHDTEAYCKLIEHLASWRERRAELRAWCAVFGSWPRAKLTRAHVLAQRVTWQKAGVAPKTINNRVASLAHLYRTLDGKRAATPCDDIAPLDVPRVRPAGVSPEVIRAVYLRLLAYRQRGILRDDKTVARFMVLAASGVRASELMRAKPEDVDLEHGVWRTRDGKGGYRPGGLYLHDDLLDAWRRFVAADAWGEFNTGSMAEVLRNCGWPDNSRPYQMRHGVGIALSERGHDLADVGAYLGHSRVDTTRSHYVPVLDSRMQRMGETLSGRIAWHSAWHPPLVVVESES